MNLQRQRGGGFEPGQVPPLVHEVLRSPGQPLDAASRAYFEPRFGHDFSRVRVHQDAQAAASARAVNALAYTVGRDIVMGDRQYAPRSAAGRALLAHELTHVIQQGQDAQFAGNSLTLGPPDDAYERDASRVATAALHAAGSADSVSHGFLNGGPVAWSAPAMSVQRHSSLYVARQCLNPDICAQYKTKRECLPRSCGYGGSGTCAWPSIAVGCCCLGAKERIPVPSKVPETEKEPKISRDDAERKLRELLPAFVVAAIGVVILAALVACFASGACEVGLILAGVGAAVALIIIGVLRHAGVDVRGAPPTLA